MSAPFVNIHTHAVTGDGIELVNIDNFDSPPAFAFASAGLHPWNIGADGGLQTLAKVEDWCVGGRVAAVGEIGLDRCIGTSVELQKDILAKQLDLAQQYKLPVVIHCVRAYSDFMQIVKNWPRVLMIFHGFNGNATTAEQLLNHGAKISFGYKLLQDNRLQAVFQAIPNDSVFFETDTNPIKISDIYNFAATLKDISVFELKQIVFNNLNRLFGNLWTTGWSGQNFY